MTRGREGGNKIPGRSFLDLAIFGARHFPVLRALGSGFAGWFALLFLGAAFSARGEDRVQLLHTPPLRGRVAEPLQIDGTLVSSAPLDRILIRYRTPEGPWAEVRMELLYGDFYRGFIPAAAMVPPAVEYYVEAVGFSGARQLIFLSAAKPARVAIQGSPEASTARPPAAPKVPRSRPLSDEGARDPRSELEEELAVYAADDVGRASVRHEAGVLRSALWVTTFDRARIEASGARSLYQLLDLVPGLSVSRDVQGFYRVGTRGIRSDPEVLFVLDGHVLNSFFDGKALADLPAENLERVEVVRGAGTSAWGHGALLAVVDVTTVPEREVARVSAGGGSFSTYDVHAAFSKEVARFRVHGDADYLSQKGYRAAIAHDALDKATIDQGRDPASPAGFTNDERQWTSIGAGGSYETPAAGRFGLSARFMNEDRGALIGLFDAVGPESALGWRVLLADATYQRAVGKGGSIELRLFAGDQNTTRTFQLTPRAFVDGSQTFEEGLRERTHVGTQAFGLEGTVRFSIAEVHRVTFGGELGDESVTAYAFEQNYRPDGTYLSQLARPEGLAYPGDAASGAATGRLHAVAFGQEEWQIVERLLLTAGLRTEAVQLPTVDSSRAISGRAFLGALLPRAQLAWQVFDPLVLKAAYGRSFRPPTVAELAQSVPDTKYNKGRFEGNPALLSAYVDTVEVGADYLQGVSSARLRMSGGLFWESFTHPIVQLDTSGNIVPTSNRQGIRVLGAEGELRLELGGRASTWLGASWARAEDLETPTSFRLLTDVPQARLNAGMTLPVGPYLLFDVVFRSGAERRSNSRTVLELVRHYRISAYSLVNAQLRTERLWDHVDLVLLVENVFNQEWADDAVRPDRVTGQVPREGVGFFVKGRVIY